jgi:hypothetical protein
MRLKYPLKIMHILPLPPFLHSPLFIKSESKHFKTRCSFGAHNNSSYNCAMFTTAMTEEILSGLLATTMTRTFSNNFLQQLPAGSTYLQPLCNTNYYYSQVLCNRNLLQFRFRLWKIFGSGSGSGSRQFLAQFSKNERTAQYLAFSMLEAAYFSESWPLIVDFFYYIFCLIQIKIRFWNRNAFQFRLS